uniref:BHLH domain-containing protein n=1 Tax=Meloidogyne incognita TaxID=6306 RepID=A0A914MBI1_MELIC
MNVKIKRRNEKHNQIANNLFEIVGKNRRDKEKNAFSILANLLPLSPPIRGIYLINFYLTKIIDQLDKAGIIRIIISYLQLNQLISDLIKNNFKENNIFLKTTKECLDDRQFKRQWAASTSNCLIKKPLLHQFALNLFQAMDGFIIVINNKGNILYVSETVAIHLGLPQALE